MALVISSTLYDAFARSTKNVKCNQLLLAFSLLINVKKLFNLDENETFISCINGIRSLSIMSIILLHSYSFRTLSPFMDENVFSDFLNTRMASSISAINISVDSFFVMSGALVTRSILQDLDR